MAKENLTEGSRYVRNSFDWIVRTREAERLDVNRETDINGKLVKTTVTIDEEESVVVGPESVRVADHVKVELVMLDKEGARAINDYYDAKMYPGQRESRPHEAVRKAAKACGLYVSLKRAKSFRAKRFHEAWIISTSRALAEMDPNQLALAAREGTFEVTPPGQEEPSGLSLSTSQA
jgi:hypothetical protein